MARHPLLQLLFTALLAWSLLGLVAKFLGAEALVCLLLVLLAVGVILWMLRFERSRLSHYYRWPALKWAIDLVCRVSGDQAPIEGPHRQRQGASPLRLRSRGEFKSAFDALRRTVRGHDLCIERLLEHLENAVTLREHTTAAGYLPPLAVIMLLGPTGVGKRHLACQLAALLHERGGFLSIDFANYTSDESVGALLGREQQPGLLTEAVRRQPYHVLVLRNIELASTKVLEALQHLLTTGVWRDANRGVIVSFQHCLIFLTTAAAESVVESDASLGMGAAWHAHCRERLVRDISLPPSLIASIGGYFVLRPLDRIARAEVVLLAMRRECHKYDVQLRQVHPRILAAEVAASEQAGNLTCVAGRVEALLREPLLQAAMRQAKSVNLGIDTVTHTPETCYS